MRRSYRAASTSDLPGNIQTQSYSHTPDSNGNGVAPKQDAAVQNLDIGPDIKAKRPQPMPFMLGYGRPIDGGNSLLLAQRNEIKLHRVVLLSTCNRFALTSSEDRDFQRGG
jgi:hypothetical protein